VAIRDDRKIEMKLSEGQKAPDFAALDQQGQQHKLSAYKGKWLLVYFYPKNDTPGCTKEACAFRDEFADLKGKVEVLGVSHDKVESHAKFASKYQLPFTLLSDPQKKIIEAYEAKGFFFTKRISYLINPEGKIAKIYSKVSPKGHAREVLRDYATSTFHR